MEKGMMLAGFVSKSTGRLIFVDPTTVRAVEERVGRSSMLVFSRGMRPQIVWGSAKEVAASVCLSLNGRAADIPQPPGNSESRLAASEVESLF